MLFPHYAISMGKDIVPVYGDYKIRNERESAMKYKKMYYIVFNAVTDSLETAKSLPDSPEKKKLLAILIQCQRAAEEIYLAGGKD